MLELNLQLGQVNAFLMQVYTLRERLACFVCLNGLVHDTRLEYFCLARTFRFEPRFSGFPQHLSNFPQKEIFSIDFQMSSSGNFRNEYDSFVNLDA